MDKWEQACGHYRRLGLYYYYADQGGELLDDASDHEGVSPRRLDDCACGC